MKTLKLTLKQQSGLLSPLQSDTIYGHFCWRMAEQLGEDRLRDFIQEYRNGNPIFLLSDGFIEAAGVIQFPKPLAAVKAVGTPATTKTSKIRNFVAFKAGKDKKHFTLEELNCFLQGKPLPEKSPEQVITTRKKRVSNVQETLRVSVQIDRYSLSSSEGKLFSYNPEYTSGDARRVVFIRILNEQQYSAFNCETVLKDVFITGFGKKKSSGYGQFEVESIEEFSQFAEPEDASAFIVFGNYLPSATEEAEPIAYSYSVKYGKLGEQLSLSDNPFKNPVVLFGAGSCFTKKTDSPFAGKVTEPGEMSESFREAVQFGMPFILGFKTN